MLGVVEREATVKLPRNHAGQAKVLRERARYNVLAAGRRWGKSKFSKRRLIAPYALDGWPVAYFAPTYKLLSPTWREMVKCLSPIISRSDKTERRIELLTGGSIDCWTLEDEDAGRGRKYKYIVVDEAGLVHNLGDIWERAIRSTLADYRGEALFTGTPKGRNFFYQLMTYAEDEGLADWAGWQMPTSTNPYIHATEIEDMKRTMTERSFAQEVLAEFIEDGGGVFRGIRKAATATLQDKKVEGHTYYIGVDWGRTEDPTVISVLDSTINEVVNVDRFFQTEFAHQKIRLVAKWKAFNKPIVLAEENSMGMPVVEDLRREGMSVQPFHTSNTSKKEIIDHLALAFEQKLIKIPNDSMLISELEAFQSTKLPSGMIRYAAPEGYHDDMVISLALAWYASARIGEPVLVM